MSALNRIHKFDELILCFIRDNVKNKYFDKIMPKITCMGNIGAIWVVMAVLISLAARSTYILYITIFTLLLSTIIGEGIIKNIVKRVRPCNRINKNKSLISKPLSYSFPSGHSLSSFAAAEVLSIFCPHLMIAFMIIAIMIAFSRIYLFVHYPSDVLAGVILGLICSKIILMA